MHTLMIVYLLLNALGYEQFTARPGTVYNNNKFKFMLLYYIVHFYKKKINFLQVHNIYSVCHA